MEFTIVQPQGNLPIKWRKARIKDLAYFLENKQGRIDKSLLEKVKWIGSIQPYYTSLLAGPCYCLSSNIERHIFKIRDGKVIKCDDKHYIFNNWKSEREIAEIDHKLLDRSIDNIIDELKEMEQVGVDLRWFNKKVKPRFLNK